MPDIALAQRLKQARETTGLSLGDAATSMGFQHYQTLSQIEAGGREVKASEVSKFSKIYFTTIDKLLGQAEDTDLMASYFLWRKAPVEQRRVPIEKRVRYLAEQCEWLEDALELKETSEFKLLDVDLSDIRTKHQVDKLANSVSMLLGLGKRPALTLSNILEQDYSVKIFYESLSDIGSAASMIHPKFGAIIVINADEAPWRRNYDLAHELFHLVTWRIVSQDDLLDPRFFEDIENKANRFASSLLLPAEEVKNELFKRIKDGQIPKGDFVDIAIEFGVSAQALGFRLANLNIIQFETAKKIGADDELKAINQFRRKKEWGKYPDSELLINLSISALRKGIISRGKFAELCSVDRCDIDDFLEQRGKLNIDGDQIEIMDY